jgi:hypothetical protein
VEKSLSRWTLRPTVGSQRCPYVSKNSASGECCVVLAELSTGNSQYVALTNDEFGQFSEAVSNIQNLLREHSAESQGQAV